MNKDSRPLRILFLNDTPRNGGPGRSLCTLLQRLDPSVIHRTVLLPRAGSVETLLRDAQAADDIVFEPLWVENIFAPWGRPMERRDFQAFWGIKRIRALGNVLRMIRAVFNILLLFKRGRHHLLYCNGTTADFVGGILARVAGIPTIWHVRYTSIPTVARDFHRWLSCSSAVRHIVCVSKASASLFPHCPSKVSVVHNGVDLHEFSPQDFDDRLRQNLGVPDDTVIFGSHGRILRKKGYIEMLMAARRALDELSSGERQRCHFVIVGDTPADFADDHLAECRQLAIALDLTQKVSFLGFQSDVRPFLKGFDVAVVPSVYPDPLPRAVIESMAFGKPVLAFDVGGVAEMLSSNEGTLVAGTPPDVTELGRQIVRYFRDPNLRARQGRAAYARILQDFDSRSHAAKVTCIIASAVSVGALPSGPAVTV